MTFISIVLPKKKIPKSTNTHSFEHGSGLSVYGPLACRIIFTLGLGCPPQTCWLYPPLSLQAKSTLIWMRKSEKKKNNDYSGLYLDTFAFWHEFPIVSILWIVRRGSFIKIFGVFLLLFCRCACVCVCLGNVHHHTHMWTQRKSLNKSSHSSKR